jgi:DNA recombination-dependent growth factor C
MLGDEAASEAAAPKNDNVAELQAEIKAKVNGLSPVEKKAMKEKLTKADLPTAFNKVTDEEVLKKILAIVAE